jgi:hypothetical protein
MFSYLKRRTRSAGVGANLIASPHRQHNRFSFLLGRVLAAEKLMQRQWKKKGTLLLRRVSMGQE